MASTDLCFHCALPNPKGARLTVSIDGDEQPVCCPGCKAVAELIRDSGMGSYYAMRDAPQPGVGRPPEETAEWQAFNSDEMLRAFADIDAADAEVSIYAGGMYCAACSWLIDTSLRKIRGVHSVDVNPITHRLRVRWSHEQTGLGDILAALSNLGYEPQPLTTDDSTRPEVAEQRTALKRLLVASLGMMQVMMFAVGLYAGDYQGMDEDMQRFLRLVSFLVSTPVVFYAGRPFFVGAWRGVATRMPGMDLPVSLAIGAAYVASVYSTLSNGEAVWFDSVVMFVFFLTLGRYLEMRARHRSIDLGAALSKLLPNTATTVVGEQRAVVPAAKLVRGDVVQIRAGDSVPADGVITRGQTSVDEALLTGEASPQRRGEGDNLSAGSVNLDNLIEMQVENAGNDTTLSAIGRMSEQARFARPVLVQIADRIASYIVIALLFVAAATALFWYWAAPERAFVITLSVLVVTCPCALALATPAAFAAAGNRFSRLRLLMTNGNAIEAMARATHIVFDKTGTLTCGTPVVQSTTVFDRELTPEQCFDIAATLEQASSHPIATAFNAGSPACVATDLEVHVAQGVSGTIDGRRWHIGNALFAFSETDDSAAAVYLGSEGRCVARFDIHDELRPAAKETLAELTAMGIKVSLASGDNEAAVGRVAQALQIRDYRSACTPDDKLRIIRSLQADGGRVVMVGDGINDAPVLAGADASIALANGALLAHTSADVIMVGNSLSPLISALQLSARTLRIVRQNLGWAILYNTIALPLAVAGLVPPWLAAIGMSASSLIVVLNALRLNR